MLLSACARQNEVELSLVSTNVVLRTEIAQVRETATKQADDMQRTVEAVGTAIALADQQGGQLRATLVSRGTDPATLGEIDAAAVTALPPIETDITGMGNPGDNIMVTPPAADGTAFETTGDMTSADPSAPALTNVVMSRSVGNNDCATGIISTFSVADEEIYVVATAMNITPGTTITARYRVGVQEIVHSFTPDFSINNNCIWFYMDKSDGEFLPGNWNVQLEINGQPATDLIPFSITG